VLRIAPGDRIITTTADAFGRDASGEEVTEPVNPQTGPFFVEGAEPGDTLTVSLDRIYPNRDSGTTATVIVPHVVEPAYVPRLPERSRIDWAIDREGGTATLTLPEATPSEITVPLSPMLGCIGVAPDREQAITSLTAGAYGGNMDYRGMVAGVTISFPVFVPGALLFLGDGHASQGDGEIVPTGIETSMDVEVTVDLLKGKRIAWPRGENDGYIFTAGTARPYQEALQHATTEMLRWLQEDYGMDMAGANLLMGHCVEYDLASVHTRTIICKMPKRMLPAPASG
jgi:acetamidase/formamidase